MTLCIRCNSDTPMAVPVRYGLALCAASGPCPVVPDPQRKRRLSGSSEDCAGDCNGASGERRHLATGPSTRPSRWHYSPKSAPDQRPQALDQLVDQAVLRRHRIARSFDIGRVRDQRQRDHLARQARERSRATVPGTVLFKLRHVGDQIIGQGVVGQNRLVRERRAAARPARRAAGQVAGARLGYSPCAGSSSASSSAVSTRRPTG